MAFTASRKNACRVAWVARASDRAGAIPQDLFRGCSRLMERFIEYKICRRSQTAKYVAVRGGFVAESQFAKFHERLGDFRATMDGTADPAMTGCPSNATERIGSVGCGRRGSLTINRT